MAVFKNEIAEIYSQYVPIINNSMGISLNCEEQFYNSQVIGPFLQLAFDLKLIDIEETLMRVAKFFA
jgi:hypothetical protein